MPVVSGAMSDRTASNAAASPSSSASLILKMSPSITRAPWIAVDADDDPARAHDAHRVLQPRSRPAPEIQHARSGPQQMQLAVDLLQLEHRPRREPRLARLLEEDVVAMM